MSVVTDRSIAAIPAGEWTIDPVWSSLEFEVKKLGLMTIKGRVPGFTGTIRGGEEPSIVGRVDVASVTTFDETRDGHLQSPDFFDVTRYPTLLFASTSIEPVGEELLVEGELTIKGVTKDVDLRGTYVGGAVDPLGNDRIGLELSTTIDRTEFGLDWNAPLSGGGFLLPNEVVLRASFAAVRAA
ncbi:MAG TPA: YceI family protein [Gaiellaceae bacterium]|nr:YceI family protein [Gaiellaceae bacterium]